MKLILTLFLLGLLTSCSCSNNAPLRDLILPEITSTTPSPDAENEIINRFINVTFSEKMRESSINANTFRLFDNEGNLVESNIDYSGTSATLKPMQSLNKLVTYTVKLARDIKDLTGNQIIRDYQWSFTTGVDEDTSSPRINGMLPIPYSTGAALDTEIIVYLNKLVSSFSVTDTSFVVTGIDSSLDDGIFVVDGTFVVDGMSIIFKPTENLAFNTKYTVALNSEIQDQTGNNLSENYFSQFTTLKSDDVDPPLVTSVSPTHKSKDIALNSNIIISFNEDINPSSANLTNLVFSPFVSSSISVSGRNIIISPDVSLSPNTQYSITIASAIVDLVGNRLQTPFNWIFTTGNLEDRLGPTVTHINPESDASNVTNNNAVTVTFSEPINPTTLDGNLSLISSFPLANVDATITYSGNTAILRPMALLKNNQTYTVSLNKEISDLSGNPMLSKYSWKFVTGETADRTIPSVTSVYPEDATKTVPTNSAIIVRFSEPMDPSSLHSDSFIVRNSDGEAIPGIMKTVGASVTFHSIDNFAFSELYTVTINKLATDLATNALSKDYAWGFSTSSEEDNISPSILATVPASSSNFAPTNRGIIVTFSETMDLSTIHSGTFYMTDTNSTAIPGNITYAGNTISFMPNERLGFSQSYVATVSAKVADLSGNPLGLIHTWSFTTSSKIDQQPPTITSTLPADAAKALINAGITVNFDKNIDPTSLNSATIILRAEGDSKNIPGTISVTPQSATLLPLEDLTYETRYNMTITTGVRDLARNSLTENYNWSFITSSTLDKEPPFVISVSPLDTQEKVSLTTSLSVNFSESINCITLNESSFTLTQDNIDIAGTVNCNGMIASFLPSNVLATQSNYIVTLNTSIEDMQRSTLTDTYTWQFSTAPWTQQFGSINEDFGEAIALDNSGNIVTAGNTSGSLAALNKGSTDIFITKHSENSLLLWSKQYGSVGDDYVTDIISDADGNLYLSGYSYGDFEGNNNGSADFILLKLNSSGEILWKKQMGTTQDDIASSLSLDKNGDLIVAGYSFKNFDGHVSNGLHDVVVIKVSTDTGAQIWSQLFGTVLFDIANDIVIDSENNIYVTGYSGSVENVPDNFGFDDITLTKLATDSSILWTRRIGTALRDQALAAAIDSSDNIYLTGFTSDALDNNVSLEGKDQFVLKYDKNGTVLWSKQFGTTGDDLANGISIDSNDNIIFTGYTAEAMDGTSFGDNDLTVMKLDASGTQLWIQQVGTEGSDLASDITADDNDNLYVVGRSEGALDGNTNAGSTDVFIIKWDADGAKQ